ncbi:MAG: aldehyde dehydrogenase (NADP(+)) [Bacteroidetes bacterium]|nr:aldehyde dehydrogenase (NADP(+)) [Rhodothermia bacterium]MCX7905912.1 aldehyde dehydrogenase (NADP(+)) [Bacteroidota bacterium]MDW8138121.1 aldehyde dehydrogenase (NADP(+)) [Bacteroidota bacterium]MDW8285805.1 aldehyde dehydrogenase (NADP(+)) [Bacteroidota bacterium]
MRLTGCSWIEGKPVRGRGRRFWALRPTDGQRLDPTYRGLGRAEVEDAVQAAQAAFPVLAVSDAEQRAKLLEQIAQNLEHCSQALLERAEAETALGGARLEGELKRTTAQLRLFAELLRARWWQDVRMDPADPHRKPAPKPEIRSFRIGIGPVAVFGAANFPLAFSTVGGDTASALAAGCPVLMKAHPAHPGTSELAGQCIVEALRAVGLPAGSFALLFDAGFGVGRALVRHPGVRAVAFTGSRTGGMALWRLAARRPDPIPVFAEMGSLNPVLVLPGALRERALPLAEGLYASFTLGVGQFCTRPGLVLLPRMREAYLLRDRLSELVSNSPSGCLLTARIHAGYHAGIVRLAQAGARLLAQGRAPAGATSPWSAVATVWEATLETFWEQEALREEVFGPVTVLLEYTEPDELLRFLDQLEGQLTLCLHAAEADLELARQLLGKALHRVGRIVWNGFPTGVEVGYATVHGGPFPATTDGRFTSVGMRAIERFLRPVALQNTPEALLPEPLRRLPVPCLVGGQWRL